VKFPELYANQIREVEANPNATRSNKILIPLHSAIAEIIAEHTSYQVISLPEKEYHFESDIGAKNVDIAIVDPATQQLKGAIMFKAIRSEYNKNANNYYENMKGESSLFIDNGIPVYQIIFIPTAVRHRNSKKELTFETPTERSYQNYCNFFNNHTPYWNGLKLGVFYFDVDYENDYQTAYANKVVPGMESTLTEGLINFMKGV
jgi:hypothetical protein